MSRHHEEKLREYINNRLENESFRLAPCELAMFESALRELIQLHDDKIKLIEQKKELVKGQIAALEEVKETRKLLRETAAVILPVLEDPRKYMDHEGNMPPGFVEQVRRIAEG